MNTANQKFMDDLEKQIKKELSKVGEATREVANAAVHTAKELLPQVGNDASPYATGYFQSEHMATINNVEHDADILHVPGSVEPGETVIITNPVLHAMEVLETGWPSGKRPHATYAIAEEIVSDQVQEICNKVCNKIDRMNKK